MKMFNPVDDCISPDNPPATTDDLGRVLSSSRAR